MTTSDGDGGRVPTDMEARDAAMEARDPFLVGGCQPRSRFLKLSANALTP